MNERALRLALVCAFPFPYPQGSQVFVADQARALRERGAAPVLFTYGRGQGVRPTDLELAPSPMWASPRAMRSGPQWGKPLADAALFSSYVRATRGGRFDFALAHNAEAALIALAARPFTRVPVVYVAHTVLLHELSAYGPRSLAPVFDQAGQSIDRAIARKADGIIALCDAARDSLEGDCRGPITVIPPGLTPAPPPSSWEVGRVCARFGLEPGSFILYAGNTDAYQDLDLLTAALAHLPPDAPPIVLATHDARGLTAECVASSRGPDPRRLHIAEVRSLDEVRALGHTALVQVISRRRPGGFPIKLLNYMEAGRPILAFAGVAQGLVHGESAWLLDARAGAPELASALSMLAGDEDLCARLGEGARSHLEAAHGWKPLADETIGFLRSLPRPQ